MKAQQFHLVNNISSDKSPAKDKTESICFGKKPPLHPLLPPEALTPLLFSVQRRQALCISEYQGCWLRLGPGNHSTLYSAPNSKLLKLP